MYGFEARAAQVEHRPVLLIDDLDAQAFGCDVEQQLVLEGLQRLALVDRPLAVPAISASSCLRRLPCGLGRVGLRLVVLTLDGPPAGSCTVAPTCRSAAASLVASRPPPRLIGRRAGAARTHLARRGLHALAGLHAGVLEVVEYRRALFLRHGGHQPHHQEERHHRGHEVRVGHLPRAAVMAARHLLDALDVDRRGLLRLEP